MVFRGFMWVSSGRRVLFDISSALTQRALLCSFPSGCSVHPVMHQNSQFSWRGIRDSASAACECKVAPDRSDLKIFEFLIKMQVGL